MTTTRKTTRKKKKKKIFDRGGEWKDVTAAFLTKKWERDGERERRTNERTASFAWGTRQRPFVRGAQATGQHAWGPPAMGRAIDFESGTCFLYLSPFQSYLVFGLLDKDFKLLTWTVVIEEGSR